MMASPLMKIPSHYSSILGHDSENPNRKLDKIIKRIKIGLPIAIGFSLLSLFFVLFNAATYEDVYAPLGPFSTQTVTNRVPNVDGPAILVGENLNVKARKCSSEKVEVTGSSTWVMIEPQRIVISDRSGQAIRKKGCEDFIYGNPPPENALKEVAKQAKKGSMITKWIVSGTETPISKTGKRGVPIVWTTEEFSIIVGDK